MSTCHLYARVSTNDQDTSAQLLSLHKAAQAYPDHIKKVIEDKASGGIPWRERGLAALLHAAEKGDVILVPEISRIGRNTADVLDFIAKVTEKGITLRVEKSGLTIGQDMQSKIISTVMALAAEIERDFLRSRTREGLAAAVAKGVKLGRPKGRAPNHPCDSFVDEIAMLRRAKVPMTSIAKLKNFTVRQIKTHVARVDDGIISETAAARYTRTPTTALPTGAK